MLKVGNKTDNTKDLHLAALKVVVVVVVANCFGCLRPINGWRCSPDAGDAQEWGGLFATKRQKQPVSSHTGSFTAGTSCEISSQLCQPVVVVVVVVVLIHTELIASKLTQLESAGLSSIIGGRWNLSSFITHDRDGNK